jgi:hypothetical protein
MRFLYRVADNELFACASNRRDFVRVSDGAVWAHESHGWLVAAGTGAPLAHLTSGVYYSAETGAPLYYEGSDPIATTPDPNVTSPHPRRPRTSAIPQ